MKAPNLNPTPIQLILKHLNPPNPHHKNPSSPYLPQPYNNNGQL